MHLRIHNLSIVLGALLIVPVLFSESAKSDPEPVQLSDVLPQDGATIPLNARLWTFGGDMEEGGGATICNEDSPEAVDCLGTPLTLEPLVQGGLIYVADLPNTAEESSVLIDVFQYRIHMVREYILGDYFDEQPPQVPQNLSVESSVRRFGGTGGRNRASIKFEWEPSQDDSGVAYYRIERIIDGESSLFARVKGAGAIFAFEPGERVTVVVSAVDIAGNVSEQSEEITGVADFIVPPACACVPYSKQSLAFPALAFVVGAILLRRRRLTFC